MNTNAVEIKEQRFHELLEDITKDINKDYRLKSWIINSKGESPSCRSLRNSTDCLLETHKTQEKAFKSNLLGFEGLKIPSYEAMTTS